MRIRTARILQPGQKIRVLVVDDSVVIRRLVCHALEEDPGIEVVGVAANGRIALSRIPQLNPDVITLDIEMPEMDGLEMLRELRRRDRATPVVMFSTMTERGAAATFEALSLGADDYVTKASNAGSLDVSLANLRHELVPKIRQFFEVASPEVPRRERPRLAPPGHSTPIAAARRRHRRLYRWAGRAGKTGPAVPRRLPAADLRRPAYAAAVHASAGRAAGHLTPLSVREAVEGEIPGPGHIYVAPGDQHMRVVNSGQARHRARSGSAAQFLPARGRRAVQFAGGCLRPQP
jgi:two-component system, chemotaxis family, protein-glutamate methylesterase/glutaminase